MKKKYYIIQFSSKKIIINSLLDDDLYSELSKKPEDSHYSGFLYFKNENDYLFSSSRNGYINIWDLYNKKIYKTINIDGLKCVKKVNHPIYGESLLTSGKDKTIKLWTIE